MFITLEMIFFSLIANQISNIAAHSGFRVLPRRVYNFFDKVHVDI